MSKPLRLLLVEDSADDAELLVRLLRRAGYAPAFRRVETAEAMAAALAEDAWDIILSDHSLPKLNGPGALAVLQRTGLDIPFIIVSGTIGEETAVECMRAGARDFLLKDKLARLPVAIERELTAARDRRRQAQEEARIRELERARELAERENHFKSQFLATMAHELRTPLACVAGYVQVLAEETHGKLNERQKRIVVNIRTSASHMGKLISDVLDFSKIVAGRLDLFLKPTSLRKLVDSMREALDPLINKHGVELRVAVADGLPDVSVDPLRINQVLFNLLSNGFKFTPKGGTVSLSVQAEMDRVAIEVRDTGVGIRAEDLPRLFQEFQQIVDPDRPRQDGSGLGLAITKRLVELHGGTVAVQSEPGRGSAFTVKLPLSRSETPTGQARCPQGNLGSGRGAASDETLHGGAPSTDTTLRARPIEPKGAET
jgi:two-component system sensor histidine kinase EvgS